MCDDGGGTSGDPGDVREIFPYLQKKMPKLDITAETQRAQRAKRKVQGKRIKA